MTLEAIFEEAEALERETTAKASKSEKTHHKSSKLRRGHAAKSGESGGKSGRENPRGRSSRPAEEVGRADDGAATLQAIFEEAEALEREREAPAPAPATAATTETGATTTATSMPRGTMQDLSPHIPVTTKESAPTGTTSTWQQNTTHDIAEEERRPEPGADDMAKVAKKGLRRFRGPGERGAGRPGQSPARQGGHYDMFSEEAVGEAGESGAGRPGKGPARQGGHYDMFREDDAAGEAGTPGAPSAAAREETHSRMAPPDRPRGGGGGVPRHEHVAPPGATAGHAAAPRHTNRVPDRPPSGRTGAYRPDAEQPVSAWYPNFLPGVAHCLNDGNQPPYMDAHASSWLHASNADCCEAHFSYALDACVAATGEENHAWGAAPPPAVLGAPSGGTRLHFGSAEFVRRHGPVYFDRARHGWDGATLRDVVRFCAARYPRDLDGWGGVPCPYEVYCPEGPSSRGKAKRRPNDARPGSSEPTVPHKRFETHLSLSLFLCRTRLCAPWGVSAWNVVRPLHFSGRSSHWLDQAGRCRVMSDLPPHHPCPQQR